MKIRHILLFFLFVVVLTCAGCGASEDYFAYRDGEVRLNVEGNAHGFAFSAELCRERDGDGVRDTLRYLAPASLEGVTLTRDRNGLLTLSMGETSRVCATEEVEGLLLPMLLLFDTPTDIERVHRSSDGCTQLSLAGGIDLTLSRDGLPCSLVSPTAYFKIMPSE